MTDLWYLCLFSVNPEPYQLTTHHQTEMVCLICALWQAYPGRDMTEYSQKYFEDSVLFLPLSFPEKIKYIIRSL